MLEILIIILPAYTMDISRCIWHIMEQKLAIVFVMERRMVLGLVIKPPHIVCHQAYFAVAWIKSAGQSRKKRLCAGGVFIRKRILIPKFMHLSQLCICQIDIRILSHPMPILVSSISFLHFFVAGRFRILHSRNSPEQSIAKIPHLFLLYIVY